MAWSDPSTQTTGDLITAAIWNQNVVNNTIALLPTAIPFVLDGGGAVIATGHHGHLEITFKCDITVASLFSEISGSIVLDIWKDTYANFPPTVANTITASAKPTLSSAQKFQDSTLTGWTVAVAAGDIFGFYVDSSTTVERVTSSLKVLRS